MRDWLGKLVPAPSGARVTELLAIAHPFRACMPPRTRFICQAIFYPPLVKLRTWLKVVFFWQTAWASVQKSTTFFRCAGMYMVWVWATSAPEGTVTFPFWKNSMVERFEGGPNHIIIFFVFNVNKIKNRQENDIKFFAPAAQKKSNFFLPKKVDFPYNNIIFFAFQ